MRGSGGQAGLPSSVGLGLYVSRLLARMMDGDLQYSRHEGRTEFSLTLPAETRPVGDLEVSEETDPAFPSRLRPALAFRRCT